MKKITYYLSLLLAVAIFTGCGTSDEVVNNGFFQKRKYNKGYHVDGFAKKKKATPAKNSEVIAEANPDAKEIETVKETSDVETTAPIFAAAKSNFIQAEKPAKVAKSKYTAPQQIKTAPLSKKEERLIKKVENRAATIKQKIENKENGSDAILYYILAIFIPWLAVGLVTDWDVKEVIINILLTLLCGIPGIIHAIIVVGRYY